jgi:serine/threonine protein kinase
VGEGGFGVVYDVHDEVEDRRVALKLLRRRDASVAELKREFRTVADVAHPNLVGFHELVADGDQWFITMELVEGPRLDRWLERVLPNAPGEEQTSWWDRFNSVMTQLVDGVAAIHAAGAVHGDIKPSNILVEEATGRLVILDFGLAGVIGEAPTRRGGTPGYVAPECARGEPTTPASDWYSVGVVMEDMLALNSSSPSARLSEAMHALLSADPRQRPVATELRALFADAGGERQKSPTLMSQRSDVFVGRRGPLDVLRGAYDDMVDGKPSALFVHGVPGIGKTALCDNFLRQVEHEGALVLAARCYERESVPYKSLDGIVDAVAHYMQTLSAERVKELLPDDVYLLAEIFAGLRDVTSFEQRPFEAAAPDAQQTRQRAFTALKQLLAAIAKTQPLVLFVDDLQWGDVDSSRLLVEILDPPNEPVMLFIGAYRSGDQPHSAALDALLTDASGSGRERPTLTLEPLDDDAAAALAVGAHDELATYDVAALTRESGGHPLFLLELVGARRRASGATTMREIIDERVGALTGESRRVLELASAAGRPISRDVLFEASRIGGKGHDVVRRLVAHRMLRSSGTAMHDVVEPFHDRLRELVLDRTDRTELRDLHNDLATALIAHGGDPETIADHLDEAGEHARAGDYALQAAGIAREALAFDRAARLYQRALEGLDLDRRRRVDLLERLGRALADAGRGADAARALSTAAQAHGGDTRDLRRRAAEQLLVSGRDREGLVLLREVLKEFNIPFPPNVTAAFLGMIATGIAMSVRGGRFKSRTQSELDPELLLRLDVLESAARGLEFHDLWRSCFYMNLFTLLSLRVGEPHRALRGLANLVGSLALEKGVTPAAQKLADETLEHAARIDDPVAAQTVHRNLALGFGYSSGLWRDGIAHFELAEEILVARCAGNMRDLRYCRMKSSLGRLRLGELRELADRCDAQLREAVDRGDLIARTALQVYAKAPLLLAGDDPVAAQRMLATSQLPSIGVFRLYHTLALGDAYLYAGDDDTAAGIWSKWWPEFRQSQLGHLPLFKLDAVRGYAAALIARGDRQSLQRVKKLCKSLSNDTVHGMRATRQMLLAGIAAREGNRVRVDELLTAATHGFEEAQMKLHAAACRYTRGAILGVDELVERAEDVMRSEMIIRPDRWARMYIPISEVRT